MTKAKKLLNIIEQKPVQGIGPSIPCKIEDSKVLRLDRATRNKLTDDIAAITSGGYYASIPLNQIFAVLDKYGVVPVQEDGTKWSGILSGADGRMTFNLAPKDSGVSGRFQHDPDTLSYTPYSNTSLYLAWHKMPSGRYEVTCYLG